MSRGVPGAQPRRGWACPFSSMKGEHIGSPLHRDVSISAPPLHQRVHLLHFLP